MGQPAKKCGRAQIVEKEWLEIMLWRRRYQTVRACNGIGRDQKVD